MKPIQVGMIGAGYMVKLHSLAMKNISSYRGASQSEFELRRLVDMNSELAKSEAKRWGWAEWDTDWKSITRDPEIDVVDVATPNFSHEEICADAFAHGKHVICEKPLSTDTVSALRMYRTAKASGQVHLVNFTYRAWPAIQQAKQLIDDGKIGAIKYFEGHFFQDHNCDETIPLHWRFKKEPSGSGALGDIGSHIIDLARFLVGDINKVSALTKTFIKERPDLRTGKIGNVEVDDLATTLVKFENGAVGNIHASWALPGYKNDVYFTIVGEKGALRFSWENNNELRYYDHSDTPQMSGYRTIITGRAHPGADLFWFPDLGGKLGLGTTGQGIGYGEAFSLSFAAFLDKLEGKSRITPSFEDGLRCNEIIDAILLSARDECWVDVIRNH